MTNMFISSAEHTYHEPRHEKERHSFSVQTISQWALEAPPFHCTQKLWHSSMGTALNWHLSTYFHVFTSVRCHWFWHPLFFSSDILLLLLLPLIGLQCILLRRLKQQYTHMTRLLVPHRMKTDSASKLGTWPENVKFTDLYINKFGFF